MSDPHRFPVGSVILVPMRVTEHRPPGTHQRDGRPDGTPASVELASLAEPWAIVALDGDDLADAVRPLDVLATIGRLVHQAAGSDDHAALSRAAAEHGVPRELTATLGRLTVT